MEQVFIAIAVILSGSGSSFKKGCDSGLRFGKTWRKATGASDCKAQCSFSVEANPPQELYWPPRKQPDEGPGPPDQTLCFQVAGNKWVGRKRQSTWS